MEHSEKHDEILRLVSSALHEQEAGNLTPATLARINAEIERLSTAARGATGSLLVTGIVARATRVPGDPPARCLDEPAALPPEFDRTSLLVLTQAAGDETPPSCEERPDPRDRRTDLPREVERRLTRTERRLYNCISSGPDATPLSEIAQHVYGERLDGPMKERILSDVRKLRARLIFADTRRTIRTSVVRLPGNRREIAFLCSEI